jgi:hypothetical protein
MDAPLVGPVSASEGDKANALANRKAPGNKGFMMRHGRPGLAILSSVATVFSRETDLRRAETLMHTAWKIECVLWSSR